MNLSKELSGVSPFDPDGVLGVMHAVASAPSVLPPSAWLKLVLPKGVPHASKVKAERVLALLLRLSHEVVADLGRHESMVPPPDEEAACESFAKGYVAGAEIDPAWREDADRWTTMLGMAYLAGRLDVIPPDRLAALEATGKDAIRQKLDATVATTHDTFALVRGADSPPHAAAAAHPKTPVTTAPGSAVGRNDACPCGSGKKYKKCCIDKPAVGRGA